MLPTRQGAFRLFRIAGISVFLHYSWFIVALWGIQVRRESYSSFGWNVLEYLALFLIVLMHEFGHAFACRSVGGTANEIVLWPLGGVAYVSPPQRAGATLWSIAAGPLVNVVLFPILSVILYFCKANGLYSSAPDAYTFLKAVWFTNLALLIFNMLPVYPLDGGQIVRSLLWFIVGRARSLLVASVIGFIGVAAFAMWAMSEQSIWLGVLAVFAGLRCWNGFQQAQAMIRLEKVPRHLEFACPSCSASPPKGSFWICGNCRVPFDAFETNGYCPNCGTRFPATLCIDCGVASPSSDWKTTTLVPPRIE